MKNLGFTKTEIEVIKLVASGYSDRKISELLFTAESTTRKHLVNIYQKMGISAHPDYNQRTLLTVNYLLKKLSIKKAQSND